MEDLDDLDDVTRRVETSGLAGTTVRDGLVRARGTLSSGSRVVRTHVAAEDALRRDEMARIANTSRLMLVLGVLGIGLIPMLDVDRTAKIVFGCVIVSNAIAYGLLLRFTTSSARYSAARVGAIAQITSLGVWGLDYTFGPFSAAPMATVLPLFAYALGASPRWTFFSYLHCAIAHLVMGIVLGAGWITDRAVVSSHDLSAANQLVAHGCIQSVLLFAWLLGRWSRKKTVASLTELENAVRQVAERDALLAELQHHLDVAVGVGSAGRFTDHVIGPYRLGALIGRGAMGEVYAAERVDGGEPAAVKMIGRGMVGSPEKVARFLRELEIARKLEAPNIVKVLAVGEPDDDLPYLAMERLRGRDLAEMLRERRILPPEVVGPMVREVAAGLDAAHAAGIVHRDLKPSNLFRHDDAIWKILDFGVSKLAGGDDLTQHAVVGTPAFMAPEQARGEPADARADVYALAAIAYRALTGSPLFAAPEIPALLYLVVHGTPARPSVLAPLHADVDLALAIGLAKEPRDRFSGAREFADALGAALHGELDPTLRERGRRLVDAHPWDARRR